MRPTSVVLICGAVCIMCLITETEGHARIFNQCNLVKELLRYNFPRGLLSKWVCIIEHASSRNTDKITHHNNGYSSYGLFQINNKDWCKKGRKGGTCMVKCEDLVNQDLSDDVRCAKKIYDKEGFKGWSSSYAYCKEKGLPNISKC